MTDPRSGASVNAFGADSIEIRRRRDRTLLAATYTAHTRCSACAHLWQIKAWSLDFTSPRPFAVECSPGGRLLTEKDSDAKHPLRAWLAKHHACT